jgi:hypothetical protein
MSKLPVFIIHDITGLFWQIGYISMSSSPTKDTDAKLPAKKSPPVNASEHQPTAAEEKGKHQEPAMTKLLASKTLLLRRALDSPLRGTEEDYPAPNVSLATSFKNVSANNDDVTTTSTFPIQYTPPLGMPLPNIPQTSTFLQQFAAFQQQQQVQFFAIQAYQRKLAIDIHEKATAAAVAEKNLNELVQRQRDQQQKTETGQAMGGCAGPDTATASVSAEPGIPGFAP